MTNEELNVAIAEKLGLMLPAFCIVSSGGTRLREQDFDSIKAAQSYIDYEDAPLMPSQRAAAKGVKIEPCERRHPAYSTDAIQTVWMMKELIREHDWQTFSDAVCDAQAAIDDGTEESIQRAVAEAFLDHLKAKEGR